MLIYLDLAYFSLDRASILNMEIRLGCWREALMWANLGAGLRPWEISRDMEVGDVS